MAWSRPRVADGDPRIGLLAPPWRIPTPGYGGVEAVVDGLCRGLTALGVGTCLWAATESTCPVTRSGIYAAADLDRQDPSHAELRHIVEGYEWLKRQGVDLIHDHTLAGPLIGPGLTQLPIVATNHLPFDLPEQQAVYSHASRNVTVIAISESQRRCAEKISIPYVIHHGIDVEALSVGDGRGDSDGPFAMFLGRMSAQKGVHVAAQACKAAGLRLKIAARMDEPHEHVYFAEAVEPLLDDRIRFLGEVDHRQKYELLRQAAVLVNPLDWPEPFGLVMIEALACGTPVAAFGRGAAPEIVEHGRSGWICNGADELIRRLATIDRIDRAVCRQRAVEKFSLERMSSRYLAAYRDLIASAVS